MTIEYLGVEFDVQYNEIDEDKTYDSPGSYTIIISSVFLNGYDALEYIEECVLDYFKSYIHDNI